MKKLSLLLAIILLVSLGCAGEKPWLAPGTEMIYDVDYQGQQYNFNVTVNELQPDVKFKWVMTDPINNEGNVTIKAAALETALGQNNRFLGGELELDDKTTVWVSKKVYNGLKNDGKAIINPGNFGGELEFTVQGTEEMTVKVDGADKVFSVIYAKADNGQFYKIWDNPDNPIIFHMSIGFEVKINHIDTHAQ